jgi:hypothetical protein
MRYSFLTAVVGFFRSQLINALPILILFNISGCSISTTIEATAKNKVDLVISFLDVGEGDALILGPDLSLKVLWPQAPIDADWNRNSVFYQSCWC